MTHGVEVAIAPNSDSALSSLSRRTEDLHSSIARRAFDLFASSGFSNGHDLADWFSAESEFLQPVPVEISENDKELTVSADLPGFTEKDIEVRVDPERVVITGQREDLSEDKKNGLVFSERHSKQVFRSVTLTSEVEPQKATASLLNGELEIKLPKKEASQKIPTKDKVA
jgi:HSP20 family molecular chaperone IbpA